MAGLTKEILAVSLTYHKMVTQSLITLSHTISKLFYDQQIMGLCDNSEALSGVMEGNSVDSDNDFLKS